MDSKEIDEIVTFEELIEYLESLAEPFRYLDDYDILVVECSKKPIIVMSPEEFERLQTKVLGEI